MNRTKMSLIFLLLLIISPIRIFGNDIDNGNYFGIKNFKKNNWIGSVGATNQYAVFNNEEWAVRALLIILRKNNNLTIHDFFMKYTNGIFDQSYFESMIKIYDFKKNQKMNLFDDQGHVIDDPRLKTIIKTIGKHESGKRIPDDVIDRGIRLFYLKKADLSKVVVLQKKVNIRIIINFFANIDFLNYYKEKILAKKLIKFN